MSHCDARVPVEVKNFLSQTIFQLFFKTCLLHVSGLWDNLKREKNFSDFQTDSSPDIAMRFERQKLPLTCNQRRRTLPVRITRKGDWSPGVSLRCESASRGQKFSKSKKFFNFFQNMFTMRAWPVARSIFDAPLGASPLCERSERGDNKLDKKHVCSTFQNSGIILSGKNVSDFQTNLSPGIVMRFERQKLPLTCNQRRRTLPVRITWKRDWSSGVSLRCESASRGQKFSSQKNFSTFFKTCLLHVSELWDNFKRKKCFRLSDQFESRYRNEIRKAETPPYL